MMSYMYMYMYSIYLMHVVQGLLDAIYNYSLGVFFFQKNGDFRLKIKIVYTLPDYTRLYVT